MAKIVEEHLVIKVSRLVKDDQEAVEPRLTDHLAKELEAVVAEIVGDDSVVEVLKGDS